MTNKEQAERSLGTTPTMSLNPQLAVAVAFTGIGYALLALLEHLEARQDEGAGNG